MDGSGAVSLAPAVVHPVLRYRKRSLITLGDVHGPLSNAEAEQPAETPATEPERPAGGMKRMK
eukprot:6312641-Prymnesium_polylepis.2